MPVLGAHGQLVCQQVLDAFTKRDSLMSFFQDISEHFYPERADFTIEHSLGEDFASRLYASEPSLFRRDFGNYIDAALRPWGRDWFKIVAQDPRLRKVLSVQQYLETRSEMTMQLLKDRRSNFSNAVRAGDHDWVTFGNAVTSVEGRSDGMGLRFRTWHLRDCAWRENYDGEVDTFYRKIKVSVRNLCSQERSKNWSIPPKVKEKLAKTPNDMVEIYHVLVPSMEYAPDKKTDAGWYSCYLMPDMQWEISAKPEYVFNYSVSRWFRIDSSPYALSPCTIIALPDGRTLQTMTWSIIEAGEKAVEPPLVAQSEAILSGVDIRSGMVTWVDQRYDERTGEAIRALELGATPEFGEALRQGITGNLKDAFYLSKLFLPQNNPQMTAEEVQRRHEEFLRVAQPVIAPAESERNASILDIAVEMAIRMKLWGPLDEMPQELRGRDVEYTFDNPLQDAQRQSKAFAFNTSMGIVSQAKQLLKPGVTEHFDETQAFRDAIAGVAPPNWLKDPDQAAEDQQLEEESQIAGQAMGEMGAMAEMAGKMPQPVAA
jgi:hypothetical protein